MNKYKTINEFLNDQDETTLVQVNELRKIILETEPSLEENVKWNAPNYILEGEDRITFNLVNKEGMVKLVLHMGASKKESKSAKPVLDDDSGLIEWKSDIRGVLSFADISDITAKRDKVAVIVKKWLALS